MLSCGDKWFWTSLQSCGDNWLWLRFHKTTTIFTLCVDWVGQTSNIASLFRGRAPTWGSAAPHSRKVPWVKAKPNLSGRNYFITMHHQAGLNFENFTEVKLRDILLTGTGHRDRRLNRDSPGQTGTCGRSNLNQNLKPKPKSNFRFIRERPFAFPSFHQTCRPPRSATPWQCPPPPALSGPCLEDMCNFRIS